MSDTRAVAPSTPTTSGEDLAVLLRLTYPGNGTDSVEITSAPLIAWVYDAANPLSPGTTPVGISNMGPAPPNTSPVLSPRWAVVYVGVSSIVYTEGEVWCGTFGDFLLWLATNNGAERTISVSLATATLTNIWNNFERSYSRYVTG